MGLSAADAPSSSALALTKVLELSTLDRSDRENGVDYVSGVATIPLGEGAFNLTALAEGAVNAADNILGCAVNSSQNASWLAGPFNQDGGLNFSSPNPMLGTLAVGPGGGTVTVRCRGARELPRGANHILQAVLSASSTAIG